MNSFDNSLEGFIAKKCVDKSVCKNQKSLNK